MKPTSYNDYSEIQYDPFGMILSGRSWEAGSEYRYGFNGKENDDEIAGNNDFLDFAARVYDCRLGRWMSLDPNGKKTPNISEYVFVSNSPITRIDPNGKTDYDVKYTVTKDKAGTVIKVVADVQIVYQVLDVNSTMPVDSKDDLATLQKNYSVDFTQSVTEKTGLRDVEIQLNININFEFINSVDEIDDDKNVMLIVNTVNQSNESVGDVLAVGNTPGQAIIIEYGQRNNLITILHEMGHNLGLYFMHNQDDPSHSSDPNNLMYPTPTSTKTNPDDFSIPFGWLALKKESGSEHHTDYYDKSNAKLEAKELFKLKAKTYDTKKARAKGL